MCCKNRACLHVASLRQNGLIFEQRSAESQASLAKIVEMSLSKLAEKRQSARDAERRTGFYA